jgi:hypothetical protein
MQTVQQNGRPIRAPLQPLEAPRVDALEGGTAGLRVLQVVAGLSYTFLFYRIYRDYISIEWGYTGLLFRSLTAWETVFVYANIAFLSAALPTRLDRPSSLVIWFLYAFVFVPTLVMTFMIGLHEASQYMPSLTAMTVALTGASIMSARRLPNVPMQGRGLPGPTFVFLMIGAFAASSAVLYYIYRDIIAFSSIEDIYFQRFAASEVSAGLASYVRTYYGYVFAASLVATGLSMARWRFLAPIGVGGFVFSYMIDAQKASLVLPIVMIAVYLSTRFTRNLTAAFTGGLAVVCAMSTLVMNLFGSAKFLVDLIVLRSIAIPAQTYAQYYDLFADRGFTWWSNVRFISSVVPPPSSYSADPFWPVLGYIVGAEYYGASSRMNANANLFVGEGVAAGGTIGVLGIGLALIVWLRAMDIAMTGWNRLFVLMIMSPIALGLTNAHLSTLLLSFGGLFWLLMFNFYKPDGRPRRS